jgi:aspartyl-tRNA(Asn)/glutamyl-tRNA(Gln) amidotransferase subunit C
MERSFASSRRTASNIGFQGEFVECAGREGERPDFAFTRKLRTRLQSGGGGRRIALSGSLDNGRFMIPDYFAAQVQTNARGILADPAASQKGPWPGLRRRRGARAGARAIIFHCRIGNSTPKKIAMSLSPDQIRQVAQLARLQLQPEQEEHTARQLSSILAMVGQLSAAATDAVEPMAHPLDMQQRLRPDAVTEQNQREAFQAIAPAVDRGLYLVPKVIE